MRENDGCTIVLFLINLDGGNNNYMEIETSVDELGFRPVKGDYIIMNDSLHNYFGEGKQAVTPLKFEDFYNKEFIVDKCTISELDYLFCDCIYRTK